MTCQIQIVGVGGLGGKKLSKVVAQTAVNDGWYAACYSVYTAAARGGEVISSVVFAKHQVDYPLVQIADYQLVLSLEALFQAPKDKLSDNTEILVFVPEGSTELLSAEKNVKYIRFPDDLPVNMVALGVIQKLAPKLTIKATEKALREAFGSKFNVVNKAFKYGRTLV